LNDRIEPAQPRTLGDQRAAIGALAAMVGMFGGLPAGHISLYKDGQAIGLSLDSPAELEAWRVALGAGPESVELHVYTGSVWLSLDATFLGVRFEVHMHQVPVPFEVASVSLEDARYRAAQLVEQRHQVVDSAEPDPGAYVALPVAWSAAVSA
jgi:hypothetical protein